MAWSAAVPPELHYLVYWILEPPHGPATALATHPAWETHHWGLDTGSVGADQEIYIKDRLTRINFGPTCIFEFLVSLGGGLVGCKDGGREPAARGSGSTVRVSSAGQGSCPRVSEHWSARRAPRRRRVSTHRPPVSSDWTHRLVAVRWLRRETVRRKHWDTLHVTVVAVARPGPPGIVRRMYWNLTDQS